MEIERERGDIYQYGWIQSQAPSRSQFQFPLASRTRGSFASGPLCFTSAAYSSSQYGSFSSRVSAPNPLSRLVLVSRRVPSLAHCQGYDGFRLRFCDFFVCVFSETFLLFFWGFSRRVSFTNERRLCGLFQRKRRHTTKREHNSTLTEAEERRGQSRNFLRAFIYSTAQPLSSTSGKVVPLRASATSTIRNICVLPTLRNVHRLETR